MEYKDYKSQIILHGLITVNRLGDSFQNRERGYIYMDDEIKNVDTGEVKNTATDTSQESDTDVITMSKAEYDSALAAAVQSEGDKIRTKHSKEVKDLNTKLAAYKSAEKTPAEIDLEKRISEIELKEKTIALKSALQSKNIDIAFCDYMKDSIDIEAFEALFNKSVTDRVKAQGYIPSEHQNNIGMTREELMKLSYSEQRKLCDANPSLLKLYQTN